MDIKNITNYKKMFFNDQIYVSHNEIFDHFRNYSITNNLKIGDISNNYFNYGPIELLKLICDKVFFYKSKNPSIKNLLYKENLFYQDFNNEIQLESYIQRLINEKVNRVLVFINNFPNRNCKRKITKNNKVELINNLNNDIIYLSDNIILLRHETFLPLLWTCKNDFDIQIKKLSLSTYFLKDKWDFSNL
tara:strand:+ start:774 stop:1343 length:570 start_codon:yes stop_codon:yes gene_type:complete